MATTKHYRVNGRDTYTVKYVKQSNGTYKIYCTERPYNPQSRDPNKTHLYSNGQVCVSRGKEPRTIDKAQAVGMAFCEGYSQYIRTGSFPNGRKRVDV